MSRTTSVTIGPQMDEFVGELLASGRYGSISEVVRSALRLLERQEQATAALTIMASGATPENERNCRREAAAEIAQ